MTTVSYADGQEFQENRHRVNAALTRSAKAVRPNALPNKTSIPNPQKTNTTMNIIEMILKLLASGDTLSKMASALGIGQEQAGKAVSAAVPTLLAALAGAASKPGGGADIANVVAKQDQGVLDNLSSLFSGGGGAAAASKGSNILGSLLGGLGGGALGQMGSGSSRVLPE